MKLVSSLLLASAFLMMGCNTNATRRDLFAPAKADGPYSDALKDSSYRYGVKQRKKKTTTTTTTAPGTQKPPVAPGTPDPDASTSTPAP